MGELRGATDLDCSVWTGPELVWSEDGVGKWDVGDGHVAECDEDCVTMQVEEVGVWGKISGCGSAGGRAGGRAGERERLTDGSVVSDEELCDVGDLGDDGGGFSCLLKIWVGGTRLEFADLSGGGEDGDGHGLDGWVVVEGGRAPWSEQALELPVVRRGRRREVRGLVEGEGLCVVVVVLGGGGARVTGTATVTSAGRPMGTSMGMGAGGQHWGIGSAGLRDCDIAILRYCDIALLPHCKVCGG